MYKRFLRPIFFRFDPEVIHNFTIKFLRGLSYIPFMFTVIRRLNSLPGHKKIKLNNLEFEHPIGLAAGLDKNAEAFETFGAMGFSFVEIGTLTPKAQPGNPKPRIFRLPKDKALINRMGFNNDGVENAVKRLKKRKNTNLIIGGNIGKNKLTPKEKAIDDYIFGLRTIEPYVDYIAINISSPNTPSLREWQQKTELEALLKSLVEEKKRLNSAKPIFVKIAPDMSFEQLDGIIELLLKYKIEGIIATNTTVERNLLNYSESDIEKIGDGGLSGSPLTKRSTEFISYINKKTNGKIFIIGVGGIMTPHDAIKKLEAGANLIQLYTGFIYEGPKLISNILKKIKNNA